MKKIKLTNITKPASEKDTYKRANTYKVTVNGKTVQFSNRDHASIFLTSTNNFCNDNFQNLNLIYADAFTLFRAAWLYFDGNSDVRKQNKCYETFDNINSQFDKIVVSTGKRLIGEQVFKGMYLIIDGLREIFEFLLPLYKDRRMNDRVHKINDRLRTLNYLEDDLRIYPDTKEDVIKKIEDIVRH